MKILTGKFRGKPIKFKANPYLRPTADKARKAVFDMLQGGIEGKRVLDLFGGTGALGFEALSNGAEFVTFVEKNKKQATAIEDNLENLGVRDKAGVLAEDALAVLPRLYQKREIYDLIFIDPPYDQGLGLEAMKLLARLPIWNSASLIFLECRRNESAPDCGGELIKSKVYGDSKILVYSFSSN